MKKNDETIKDTSKVYTGTFNQSLELSDDCTFEISIETYSDNSISIDGKKFLLIKRVGSRGSLPLSHYKLVRDTKNLLKNMKLNMRIVTMVTIMIMVTQMKIYMHKGRM